ncbi:MAG TPA: hypothetical protein VL974_10255 [Magnetospirillum sp.]|jgi:hypothetical protein|nr:hypothetical protein [Magnetospirillum sp.]
MNRVLPLAFLLVLSACTAPDRPASPERLGRFMGLVAHCGCSDVSLDRMMAEYPRAVSAYSAGDINRIRGFIEVGGRENFSNQVPICAEVCSQTCAVNAVVLPLGGRPLGNGAPCALTEGGLHLTEGWSDTE